jgi:hypothetical protein
MKKKEARPTPPLVELVEAPFMLRLLSMLYSIMFFLTQGSFYKGISL